MDHGNGLGERAAEHFKRGYNCAQSVLLTMLEHWHLKNELVPKIATGFGGGIGRCGSVCGALTGGVMAISLKCGTNEPLMKERLKAYETAQKFYDQFEAQNGSVLCKNSSDLICRFPSSGTKLSGQMSSRKGARFLSEKLSRFFWSLLKAFASY
ncbi:MAG: C-GCAxxG-C-C family protein [Candidatus Bathyarchaeia archaeon]